MQITILCISKLGKLIFLEEVLPPLQLFIEKKATLQLFQDGFRFILDRTREFFVVS